MRPLSTVIDGSSLFVYAHLAFCYPTSKIYLFVHEFVFTLVFVLLTFVKKLNNELIIIFTGPFMLFTFMYLIHKHDQHPFNEYFSLYDLEDEVNNILKVN